MLRKSRAAFAGAGKDLGRYPLNGKPSAVHWGVISKMTVRNSQEIEHLRQRLEKEKARVHALSQELDAARTTLNALLGRDGGSQCDLKRINSTIERQSIEAALMAFKGNVTAAARKLGMSRQSLYTKMRAHGIELTSKRSA